MNLPHGPARRAFGSESLWLQTNLAISRNNNIHEASPLDQGGTQVSSPTPSSCIYPVFGSKNYQGFGVLYTYCPER
jgi:hypothetical protein